MIRVEALALSRGGRVLFENLSFAAAPGDYVEVQGSNGSGKTSLLRAVAGLLRPRGGVIAFEGAEEPSLALHYVGHANGLKREASAREHLRYWTGLFGGSASEDDVAQTLEIGRVMDLPVRVLSQGQARRLALSRLLIAPRPVWLLDEPVAALDDAGKAAVNGMIASHRATGGLVIAAVHEALGPAPTKTLQVRR
ncbi:MAG: heme ABC exporter ATP-binding protein CcmA [Hyphomonadaceae bacterium]|nr:heme ABC exporter ATP-binding protein CcmA [Hyphomonadaceae bacterium]